MGVPTAIGGVLGNSALPGAGAVAGAIAGAAVPKVAGKVLMDDWVQDYLANQAVQPRASTDLRGGALAGILTPELFAAIGQPDGRAAPVIEQDILDAIYR